MARKIDPGFTLIEMLVVMSIVAVLIGLSLVALQATRASARDGKRKADLEQVRSALEMYRTDCRTYPATVTWGSDLTGVEADCLGNVYLAEAPTDPLAPDYNYAYNRTSANSYDLCSYLEGGGGNYSGSCGAAGGCGLADCSYKVTNP